MIEITTEKLIKVVEYKTKDGEVFALKKDAEAWERVIGLTKVFVLIHRAQRETIILFDSYDKVEDFYTRNTEDSYLLQELYINECTPDILVREYNRIVRQRG